MASPTTFTQLAAGVARDPRDRWYSSVTQDIANRLPPHTEIRNRKTSVGQELINASGGIHFEDVQRQLEQGFRDQFLITAGLNEPDQIRRIQLVPVRGLARPEQETNLSRNGSFSLWSTPTRLPDFWEATGTGIIDVATGVFTGRAMTILPTSGELSLLQEIALTKRKGEKLTVSAWYRNPGGATGTPPSSGFGLRVTVTKADSTTQAETTLFSTTASAAWRQATVTLTLEADIVELKIELVSTIGGGFTPTVVEVDAIQAVDGSTVKPWLPSIFDRPQWYEFQEVEEGELLIPPVAIEFGIRVQIVEDVRAFWKLPPMRAELIDSRTFSPVTIRAGFTTELEESGAVFLAEWVPNGTKVRKIGRVEDSPDVYGDFDLAFPTFDGNFLVSTATAIEAVALFNEFLWVIGRFTRYDGEIVRMLCVVDPKFPRATPTDLEVLVALELTGVPAITSARFRFEDPLWLFLNDGTREYGIRLFYDYALYEVEEDRLFLREQYLKVVTTKLSPRRRRPELRLNRTV